MLEQKATELLQQFADKLGVTVEHVWNVMVQQAYATAIVKGQIIYYLWWILGIAIGTGLALLITGISKTNKHQYNSFAESMAMWGMSILVLSIIGVIAMIDLYTGLYYIQVNPEYWALEKIMEVIK